MNKSILFIIVILLLLTNPNYSKNSLKIGSDEWAPFHFKGKSVSDVQGYTADLVRAVLENMDVKIEDHKIYPWKRALNMVFKGELDAVFTTTKTPEREKNCFFPEEALTDFTYVLFVKKVNEEKLKFETLSDLRGHIIGTVRGFSYTKEFKEFIKKEKNYYEVTTGDKNIKKLLSGRIDYMVTPRRVGLDLVSKFDLNNSCIMIEKPLNQDFLYIMFSKKTVKEEFVNKFSEELKQFKLSKEYRKIVKKYNWR